MKKIVALAVLAVGMLVGAGSAAAYPPEPKPSISPPITVGPNDPVTMTVYNVSVGLEVSLTFLGTTYTGTVPLPEGLSPPAPTGSVSFPLMAPDKVGEYPVTATLPNGDELTSSVTVLGVAPPTTDGGGNGGGNNGGSGSGSGSGGGSKGTGSKATSSGKLPATGAMLAPGVGFGLAALAGGTTLLIVSKRRRTAKL